MTIIAPAGAKAGMLIRVWVVVEEDEPGESPELTGTLLMSPVAEGERAAVRVDADAKLETALLPPSSSGLPCWGDMVVGAENGRERTEPSKIYG